MNFIETLQYHYDKLPNMTIVTNLWIEIITGKKCEVSSDHLIEYSFHYPVDTDVYLEELNQKFDDSMKEDLRTIEGNLKAYLQTFLYYCLGSSDRIPIRTGLYAAEIYVKLILLPSDIGKLYFEKNLYITVLQILNSTSKKSNFPEHQVQSILELIFKYTSQNEVSFSIIQGTANVCANIVKHRSPEGNIKQCDDSLATYSLKCLKDLVVIKEHPKEIKYIMESMLRCLRSKPCETITQTQRRLAVNISKKFIMNVLLVEIEDKNKVQYFIDSLFDILGMADFDLCEDCVDIMNMLDEQLYKEFLRRIPNYLESKNHERYYVNLIKLVYQILMTPHPKKFDKLDVLLSVCFRDILMHLLNKKRVIQDKTADILAKICLLQDNAMIDGIFELVNVTGKFVTLETSSILRAIIKILDDKYAGNTVRSKNLLHLVSKMLISLNVVDGNLASQVLYLICKDGTPFSIKNILPNLHQLYLQLSEKLERDVRLAILRIFVKMAMHSDVSSSVFLEHLYKCIVYSSTLNGKRYGPESYSNLLLSDEFEHSLLLTKCRQFIKYDHVYHTIANLNFREPGHCVLLNSLLEFVKYKEYNILTDYIVENYAEICFVETAGQLLNAYNRILVNKGVYNAADFPKFDTIHGLLWDSLFKQLCGIINIKPTFALIDTLKGILQLEDDEHQRVNLLTIASERAYRALTLNQFHQGSVMHLTELCIALKRPPRPEILIIFENVMEHPGTTTLLKTHCKDTLIQLIAFFGTVGMMDRRKIPTAGKLFRMALDIPDPVVQLTALKMYYNLCTEITHEFEDIIKFCLQHVTSCHPVLSRICVLILEELIHDNYVLLNSEDFLRFVHRLGTYSLHEFMEHTLENRFMLSNKHDIGRFYMTTLVYISGHTKLDNYPISPAFMDDLTLIRSLIDCPNDLLKFLFSSIQIKTRFNILREICSIYDTLVAGKSRVDEQFFTYFHHALYTFKVMSGKAEFTYKENYYGQVCRAIEKQIFNRDPKFKDPAFYGEYEVDVRRCTLSLLELLFFVKNEELMKDLLFPVFDTVVCWIDHVKPELIHYKHYEKGKDYDHHLKRLIHFFKSNKQRLENYISNQESIRKPSYQHSVLTNILNRFAQLWLDRNSDDND